jgi:DNA-binding NarL/FixJ family response regulator
MIVEDEAVIALRLQHMLTKMGYHVAGISYTGEDALEKARSLGPDLLLMDIKIPGELDGIDVAEMVKSELNIPVIFLTAFAEDKIIERAKKAEPFGYILKPFQDREIKAAIEVAFYKKKAQEALKKAHNDLDRRVKERTFELNDALKTLKLSETELSQRKSALEKLNRELLETNQALSVLARNIDKNKEELEERYFKLCNSKIIPILKGLQNDVYCQKRQADLELMITYLNEAFRESPQHERIDYYLTDQEMRVAVMIRNGLSNQQIADLLCISLHTVKTHRKNIRKKLKISNTDINLVSYLKSRLKKD